MKLVLLDGYSLAYRAFYALPSDLATPTGTFTNAVYGFTTMLVKLFGDERPDGIAVVFDAPGGSFRNALDSEYKATRKETPELFSGQVPLIHEVLAALAVPTISVAGVEADDVIATLAHRAAEEGIDVVIVTGDRDSFQLVSDPHVKVLYNRRGVSDYALYDVAGIVERTGVLPSQYVDYAAMRGDTSDNLPGVAGIGEKTAAKLINEYGHLEAIFENLDRLPPRQRQSLGEARDRVFRNREMMQLRLDCDVPTAPAELRQGSFDTEAVRELFNRLAFRQVYPRLLDALGITAGGGEGDGGSRAGNSTGDSTAGVTGDGGGSLEVTVVLVDDAAALQAVIERLVAIGAPYAIEPRWAARAGKSALLGLGIAVHVGHLVDAAHAVDTVDIASVVADPGVPGRFDAWFVPAALAGAFVEAAGSTGLVAPGGPFLIAHGAKELMRGLPALDVRSLHHDIPIMAYLLDPGAGSYKLEDLAQRLLGFDLAGPDGQSAGQLDFDGSASAHETCRRAAAALALAPVLDEGLRAQELTSLYESVERPLVRVLAAMEEIGVGIDVEFLNRLATELTKERDELEHRIHEHAGEPFNIGSTQQLQKILYEKLGLSPSKKTKTGASTDAASLQKLVGLHPIIDDLLRYREVDKLRSTYALAFPPLVEADGRIHAVLNQTATATGRISSEQPNLQNIPVRSADGRAFRRAFIPSEGCVLLVADYSQIEMRVLAHLADDPGLIDAFERDADVHTATAARVFGVPESEVTLQHRRFAKVVNYGLAYGMEAYGLAQRAEIEVDEAKAILEAYFAGFPRVRSYMDTVVKDARSCGYTTTLLGRRRQLPELTSDNFRIRDMGKRMAQNAPVQGSAADIFKLAMVHLDRALDDGRFRSRMVLTVHDELVLEVPFDERPQVGSLVREVMEGAFPLRVPLRVDLAFGETWADAKG